MYFAVSSCMKMWWPVQHNVTVCTTGIAHCNIGNICDKHWKTATENVPGIGDTLGERTSLKTNWRGKDWGDLDTYKNTGKTNTERMQTAEQGHRRISQKKNTKQNKSNSVGRKEPWDWSVTVWDFCFLWHRQFTTLKFLVKIKLRCKFRKWKNLQIFHNHIRNLININFTICTYTMWKKMWYVALLVNTTQRYVDSWGFTSHFAYTHFNKNNKTEPTPHSQSEILHHSRVFAYHSEVSTCS